MTVALRDPIPLISTQSRLVLLTNGKCGGTSLKRWFLSATIRPTGLFGFPALAANTSLAFARWLHFKGGRRVLSNLAEDTAVRETTKVYQRTVSRHRLERAVRDGYTVVLVSRDPCDRAISAYLEKFCGSDLPKPWVQRVISASGTDGTLSFLQFLDYLEATDNDICNHHWRRQSYVAVPFGAAVRFVRLERLQEDLAALDHPLLTRAAAEIGVSNPNRYRKGNLSPEVPDAAALSNRELIALRDRHDAFPPARSFLTDDAVRRLRQIYAKDYVVLPYE